MNLTSLSQTLSTLDVGPPTPRRFANKTEHVLVCLDGAPRSEVALSYAILLASTFGARVTLLHVMHARGSAASPTDAFGWEFARQRANGYLEGLRVRLGASGVATETVVLEGNPATRIAAFANDVRADVIVLTSHGEGGSVDFEIGSTAQQVISLARASVLLARSSLQARPSNIVLPLDGSARTECVIPTAVQLAKRHDASITLVHVVSEPVRSSILSEGDLEMARTLAHRLEAGAQVYLDHVKQQISHEVRGVRTVVLRDEHAHEALCDFAQQEGADLVLVSAHGTTCNAARACGSTSSFLLAHACPAILMIQDVPNHELARNDHGPRATGTVPRSPGHSHRVVAA